MRECGPVGRQRQVERLPDDERRETHGRVTFVTGIAARFSCSARSFVLCHRQTALWQGTPELLLFYQKGIDIGWSCVFLETISCRRLFTLGSRRNEWRPEGAASFHCKEEGQWEGIGFVVQSSFA